MDADRLLDSMGSVVAKLLRRLVSRSSQSQRMIWIQSLFTDVDEARCSGLAKASGCTVIAAMTSCKYNGPMAAIGAGGN